MGSIHMYPEVGQAFGTPVATADALATGSSLLTVRADHVHRTPGLKIPATAFPVASPIDGDLFYEQDTDKLWAYDGANWVQQVASGQWDSYVPAISGTGWVLGSGSTDGRWTRMGRTIFFSGNINFGAGCASGTGQLGITVPKTCDDYTFYHWLRIRDDSGGTAGSYGWGEISAGGNVMFVFIVKTADANPRYLLPAGLITANMPFTLATLDNVMFHGYYEAAAST